MFQKYKIKEKIKEFLFIIKGVTSILFHILLLFINKLEKIDLRINEFWIIPVITAYVYAVTILTEYGYNSFFDIPQSFIEASVAGNIIYFHDLINLIFSLVYILKWQLLIFTVIVVVLIIIFRLNYKKTSILILIIILLAILGVSYNLGKFLGANETSFYVLSPDCPPIGPYRFYIIPNIYQGKAILVPYDENSKKMKGGFLVKDTAEIGCLIERKQIGKIER